MLLSVLIEPMRTLHLTCISVALIAKVPLAWAVDTTMTPNGYTGLSMTPNAHVVPWGRVETEYDNQLPGVVRDPTGHNFVASFGLLPNLEVAARIAASTLNNNCFIQGCGTVRDLSATAKVGIGLDSSNHFRAALGATDFGGAATYFRAYYGVLTYNEGPFEMSGGLAKRSDSGTNVSKSPLNGPFTGAAWQPLSWVRGHIEYTDRNAWAGLRLFAPSQWLPEGWVASVGANQRLTSGNLTGKSWWSMGLSIPLNKIPDLRTSSADAYGTALPTLAAGQPYEVHASPFAQQKASPQAAETKSDSVLLITANPVNSSQPSDEIPTKVKPVLDSHLIQLLAALKAKGLEDISVGRMPDGSIAVSANNSSYKWNSLDALGAAMGAVSRTLGFATTSYRLLLTQRQIPLVAVTGQTDCLRQWVNHESEACAGAQLSTPGAGPLEPLLAGANWLVQGAQPSWQTLRVAFSPVLRTNFATDLAVFDFSLGVNASLSLPLWRSANVEWSRNIPLGNTRDYEPQGVFGGRRVRSGTERLAFTQTARVPLERLLAPDNDAMASRWGLGAVTAQGTVGRVGSYFDGASVSFRWEPGDGLHRWGAQGGVFRNSDFNKVNGVLPDLRVAKPLLTNYRYAFMPTRTYLEATAGQFMNNDRGVQLGMRQWFTDVAVNAYFRRTGFVNNKTHNFIGLEILMPIGPRQDSAPSNHFQFSGTQRFSHAVELLLDSPNTVSPGYGAMPPVPSIDAIFNSDRASLAYFEDNIRRIRDSAR